MVEGMRENLNWWKPVSMRVSDRNTDSTVSAMHLGNIVNCFRKTGLLVARTGFFVTFVLGLQRGHQKINEGTHLRRQVFAAGVDRVDAEFRRLPIR